MRAHGVRLLVLLAALAPLLLPVPAGAGGKLRLLTWADYVPQEVAELFTRETGIEVEVTLSDNEDMIRRLRVLDTEPFDLAQPSQDRVAGQIGEDALYKPLDLSRIRMDLVIPSMFEATRRNTSRDGQIYGLPHVWGTDGLILNLPHTPGVSDYADLCNPNLAGRVSVRAKRATLIAFALSRGLDPFEAYKDPVAYEKMMERVVAELEACRGNIRFFWDTKAELLDALRRGEIHAALAWDTGGWELNAENPNIRFVAPRSGALGWIDTFAIPAKGRNDDAAYQWINFNLRPDIAAMVARSARNFTASRGADRLIDERLRSQFAESFPRAAIENIQWYPAVPAGLEEIEARVLAHLRRVIPSR
ncbi:extracellular solute-binding protein [Microvirga massiliensis]|uniref:extracellular solute-binding protein n=1 Tax=Microvirga massiliensis TaxID=1033741 RepID=UPI00062B5184|nr:extracellular solute-binding protein [Microvirga massiliensis]